MGEEDQSRGREGEREEVGQGPIGEQSDERDKGEEREAAVTRALQLPLVCHAPSEVGQISFSTHLL